jgi:hypothetical protein
MNTLHRLGLVRKIFLYKEPKDRNIFYTKRNNLVLIIENNFLAIRNNFLFLMRKKVTLQNQFNLI